MLLRKSLLFIISILFLLNVVYSVGVYDDQGNYVYYISNPDPYINVTLQSTAEIIQVRDATLTVNSNEYTHVISDQLFPTQTKNYSFTLDNFAYSNLLELEDLIYFNLVVLDQQRERVSPRGDPVNFEIKLDTSIPRINFPEPGRDVLLSSTENEVMFDFNEKISYYRITVNGEVFQEFREPSLFLSDFRKSFDVEFPENLLNEGRNDLEIYFEDVAENPNSQNYSFFYRGEPLNITLLTKKEDSSLPYFYDSRFPDFFNKSIYSDEREFELVVETNKEAFCYYSSSLLSYDTFNKITPKTLMESSDGRVHTIEVNTAAEDKFWLACQNVTYVDDIAYLSDQLGLPNQLIGLKYNTGAELDFEHALPEGLVSGVPFNLDVKTSAKAVCTYSIDSSNPQLMDSENYLDHFKTGVESSDGEKPLEFTCFDLTYNIISQTNNIDIDKDRGIQVTSYEPKYTSSTSASIQISLSEDALCRYSDRQRRTSEFSQLDELPGTGLTRTLDVNGLTMGDNFYYIYCQKFNNVNLNTLNIIYDPNGPRLENLTFTNVGGDSDYISSPMRLSFEFDVVSLIPMDRYYVSLIYNNSIFEDTISSNSATIRENLIGANKLRIIGQNIIGQNSSPIEKNIKIDINPPVTNFLIQGETIKITCFDAESGCRSIKYGFANQLDNCNPRLSYDTNETLEVRDYNFVCASSQDNAGNTDEIQQELEPEFSGGGGNFRDPINNITEINRTDSDSDSDSEENDTIIDDEDENDVEPIQPFEPNLGQNDDDNNLTLAIIAGAAILLLGLGGGGYYAYRKGYLDDQLEKMGILKPQRNKNGAQTPGNYYSSPSTSLSQNSPAAKKSKYDDHLKRLNDFIDETLDKRNKVFGSFKDSHKGKAKGYEDTLIRRDSNKGKDSDFDSFYDSTKKSNSNKDEIKTSNIEKDAEEFEKYHKDRKDEPDSKDKSKEIKKKKK